MIDVETTMNCPIGGNKANPFFPGNHVVLEGHKRGDAITSEPAQWHPDPKNPVQFGSPLFGKKATDIELLVGQNIGFDIHHKRVAKTIDEEFLGTVRLWDTQLAEYLLTGQQHTYASLDELCMKYGLGVAKDTRVSDLFAKGIGADAVPMEWLKPYHADDLVNTELVFAKQFEKAQEMGMLPLITTQMDALAATIEMTYNGLAVDQKKLYDGALLLRVEVGNLEADLKTQALAWGFHDFNPGSPKQLSTLLFGGQIKYTEREQVGVTKAGKPKFRNVEKVWTHSRLFIPKGAVNGNGYYSTDDAVLQGLREYAVQPYLRFLDKLIDLREKDKQLGTYWEGLLKLVMPDGLIHHSLNHAVTKTGRLACSNPNLQNQTNGPIKEVFVSRWGDDGVIVEADFKQLEMVELAILSGDPVLIADIHDGRDMHNALFYDMHGRDMRPEERKSFKRCSFALVYGAGATGVAEQGGCSKVEAKRFIETFYTRYKGVKNYHDTLIQWAKDNRKYKGRKDPTTGKPSGEAEWIAHSGRRYVFHEYQTPEFLQRQGKDMGFSPTELKNYMVQGGATGDKVPLCIGKLYRKLMANALLRHKCLLTNTVHDSVLFDVHKDVLQEALSFIKTTMELTPAYYEEAFGVRMPLPLKVELSYGPNWKNQTEVHYQDSEWRLAA